MDYRVQIFWNGQWRNANREWMTRERALLFQQAIEYKQGYAARVAFDPWD